ncbi:MAG: dTDP-4-dehydrorhamnose 3,5-epimerase, partial [Pseudomonadota bacterium]|nr:dTDP-4-dehydrorhamnose 3,5-epimerase [Pseudomonadota bacterium]
SLNMIFHATSLPDAFIVEPELLGDERGLFARAWCREAFAEHGLNAELAQCSLSYTRERATLRGMHYQRPPHGETKLVRVTRGAIYDVALDLRPDSVTFCQWSAVELTAENRKMSYIPDGFAHGFVTLTDDVEVFYQVSVPHEPASAAGVRWDDPAFNIDWPVDQPVLSERDASFPDFHP